MERRLATVEQDSDVRLPQSPGTPVANDSADIVKRGCMYIKKPPTNRTVSLSIKSWQKRYLVLRDVCHLSGATTLEVFDRETQANASCTTTTNPNHSPSSSPTGGDTGSPYIVDLRSVTTVEPYLESRRFQQAFIVHRIDVPPIIFGADSELEMRCWLTSIKLLAKKVNGDAYSDEKPRNPSCPAHMGHEVNLVRQRQKMGLRLNRSTPQLDSVHVGGNLAGIAYRTRHDSAATTCRISPVPDGHAYIDIVDGSLRPPSVEENNSEHPLRRIFTASFLSNFGSVKDAGVVHKRKFIIKDRRKDSGFSDSFEDRSPMDEDQTAPFCLSSTPLPEEDHPSIPSPSPRPGDSCSPPLPPPRHAILFEEDLTSRRPTPPPKSATSLEEESPQGSPPTPPPRPDQSSRRPSLTERGKSLGSSCQRDPFSERPTHRDGSPFSGSVPPLVPPRPERLTSPSVRPLPREPPSLFELSPSPPRPPPRPLHTLPMTCMVKH